MISAETQGGRFPRLLQAAIDAFSIPDLRGKILFTLAMLALYRFIAHISIPGIDPDRVEDLVNNNQILGFLDLFSGGAFRRMSIVALGVFPYITASIVIQLLTPVVPSLQELSREGEAGRAKMNRMVHWLTVPIATAQGYGQLLLLQQSQIIAVGFSGDTLLPTLAALLSIVAGTLFLVWLGELITERGIGNGISLIIFAGIVAGFPGLLSQGFVNRDNLLGVGFFAIIGVLIIALIVMFNEAHRRIPVQYGRSIFRGGRMYRQSGATYLPLRINSAGMIPLIFAFSIVILPGTVATYLGATDTGWLRDTANFFADLLVPSRPFYWIMVFILVVIFTFFYTLVVFNQQNLAENLQRNGGFVLGIRPGRPTQEYLNRVIVRITMGGALFLGFIAVVPYLASLITDVQAIALSSTALLIMVGVGLDTMRQLEAQLMMRNYEGFLR